ncbi:MAG: hypothetical protein ONB16_09240 [candidate division KSB1 bacterium]|nr:hypothetical protein [candidate division KSB1 bacterium]MDZ7341642.1 hypothetical protein [candidate division KSB1 bacterium]
MIKKIIPGLTLCLILLLMASQVLAVEGTRSGSKLDKTLTRRAVKYIDVNQIRSSVMNNGTFTRHPISGNSDMEWPKGSGKYICYNAGIWVSGKVNDVIRTACADYNVEYQPGVILPNGSPDDPEKPEYRVYKAHKDYPNGDDALEIDSWATWQTYAEAQGAPAVTNDQGEWIGIGDEMLYAVMNDLDQNLHNGCYNTLPIGIELHLLVFGFDRAGALGNTIFIRYTLINKGRDDLKDAYIGAWSDVDNGDANDDLVGFDTNLGMAYCYGGKPVDATYGPRPPALGWDYFQGPIVNSPGSTVVLPDGRVFKDKKILGATGFVKYYNGNAIYSDPPYSAAGAEQVWNYMTGRQKDGTPFIDPTTGQPSTVCNTGDPVTGTGWLSTKESPPADIRMLISSGPFTLAVGDTQEIVLGCVIGQGSNRLSSISVLRFYDQAAQQAYDLGFKVPSPPPSPAVTVSELDRKVLVTWEKNAENFKSSYKFEGYNVYVGASPAGPWKRLATYDLANELGVILEPSYDETSGEILNLPSAFGNNLGTKYNYLFTKDYNDMRLANGRTYYFLVTSYAYDPNSLPNVLESSKNIIYAVPHQARPGTVVTHDAFSEVPVVHSKGDASPRKYSVWVKLIDPLHVTTADYRITINSDKTWTLWRNNVEVPGYTNVATYGINKDIEYQTLQGAPLDFFLGLTVDFVQQTLTTWEPEMIAGDPALLNSLTSPSRQKIRTTDLAIDGQFKKGTRNPALINNSLQIRFTGTMDEATRKVASGGCLATLLFSYGDPANFMPKHPENPNPGSRNPFLVRVPFEIWDVVRNKQLNVAFTDNAQKLTDADFVPTWAPRGKCVVYTVASDYDEQVHNITTTGTDTMATWTFIFDETAVWKTGDIVQLNIPNPDTFPKPVVPGVDEFSFRIQGETDGVLADAKERLDIINVYPNPYLAYNITETRLHQERVTFINLPATCTIRIFSISGQLVRTIEHNATSTNDVTENWDLRNENNLPVASGFYIAHIEVPGVGEKILKLAIVFRQQRLKNL